MGKEVLKVQNIEKYYGKKGNITKAINDISFTVSEGEFVGIMGASGSGKTTLLNCISTIDKVTSGHIYLDGEDVTTLGDKKISKLRRERIGFIFQDFNLLDTLTAYENIALALTIQRVNNKEIDKRVRDMAKALNITEVLNKYPYEMSGGQKQRVASARAIVHSIVGLEVSSTIVRLFGDSSIVTNVILTAVILVVIYGGYFLATYLSAKKNISEKY